MKDHPQIDIKKKKSDILKKKGWSVMMNSIAFKYEHKHIICKGVVLKQDWSLPQVTWGGLFFIGGGGFNCLSRYIVTQLAVTFLCACLVLCYEHFLIILCVELWSAI